MAEGSGGDAAVRSFLELTRSAGQVAQRVRARLASSEAKSTWLGPSAELADAIAGSVLRCASSEAGSFWAVIPPRVPSVASVRRSRGAVTVRVTRDGALASARYEELISFHEFVQGIVPGILTMSGAQGALARTVKLLASGDDATVSVFTEASSPTARPFFVFECGSEEVIGPTPDFAAVLAALSVQEIPWATFARGEWWGLPPVEVAPVVRPMPWATTQDALGIATVFGMPPASSNTEVLQFLVGCCEPPPAWVTVDELSQACADNAPVEESAALAAVLSQLSAATQCTPTIVDSVHSRLKAITQSEDAPALFVAFGRAWRQAALEPPTRRASQAAPPSPVGTQRRASRTSSPHARATTLDEELSLMSPNTMRYKLRAFLAASTAGGEARLAPTAAEAAGTLPTTTSPGSVARRSPSRRVAHSGQLGGLFLGGLGAVDPSLTTSRVAPRPAQTVPSSSVAAASAAPPGPTPEVPSAPSVASVLPTISPDECAARATAVIVPADVHHMPVTAVVQGLVAHGMPDVVAQLAHAAGDMALRAAPGSTFEALSLLRHIEEVFADVCGAAPSFDSFRERPAARDWREAVEAVQVLLGKHSSIFRAKRQRGPSTTVEQAASLGAVDDKPPAGSFKQVSVATNAERTGACDAQLLEEMASAAALRREHVRASVFSVPNVSTAARDTALPGELAHFCSTYGQAATAYILSNGTTTAALSGCGVPMALATIRAHLLARATQLIHKTVGFERALLSMSAKCEKLATGFLSGVMDLEDCVAILGGSAPHEEAEIRREGGAVSSGTLGTTSGDNAQLSIREAFAAWGQGLHLVMGDIPGVVTSGVDFEVGAQLKKIPRDLDLTRLLSICRYMLWNLGVDLSRHRTVRGAPLPDVCAVVHTAMTKVFLERERDQRAEERAAVVLGPMVGPMMARIQQLEAAQAKSKSSYSAASPAAVVGKDKRAAKSAARSQAGKSGDSPTEPAPAGTSAQEAAQKFLLSLQSKTPSGQSASTPQPLVPASPSAGAGQLTSRLKAIMELSAIYRTHAGMDPKGDPTQEPCSYKALFGKCGQPDCARCRSGKSFPPAMVEAVKARCLPSLFGEGPSSSSGGRKGGTGKAKEEAK